MKARALVNAEQSVEFVATLATFDVEAFDAAARLEFEAGVARALGVGRDNVGVVGARAVGSPLPQRGLVHDVSMSCEASHASRRAVLTVLLPMALALQGIAPPLLAHAADATAPTGALSTEAKL